MASVNCFTCSIYCVLYIVYNNIAGGIGSPDRRLLVTGCIFREFIVQTTQTFVSSPRNNNNYVATWMGVIYYVHVTPILYFKYICTKNRGS